MHNIHRILFAIKDTDAVSSTSLAKVSHLARAFGAEVDLFHAIATPLYSSSYEFAPERIELAERQIASNCTDRLKQAAETLHKEGIRTTVSVEWDFPAYEAIIRRATQTNADLIVANQHGSHHIAPHLLRLTDWELLRVSPVPLLLIKNPQRYTRPVVLAAVDPMHRYSKPSGLDQEILQIAHLFASGLKGTLHAIHALPAMQLPLGVAPANGYAAQQAIAVDEAERERAVSALTQELRPFAISESNIHLAVGAPSDAIERAAQDAEASLVVMGSVSRSGLKRLFIGNTAERVLDDLTCDLLLVKAPNFPVAIADVARGAQIMAPQIPLIA